MADSSPGAPPLTLIGETAGQVAAAQRDLARIGIEHLAGAAVGLRSGQAGAPRLAAYPLSDFAGLTAARRRQAVTVLDVRFAREWEASHIEGALHIPLHQLPGRLRDLPRTPIWVHCQAGYRASVAASLLQAAGHAVTAIDDNYGRAEEAGLPVAGRAVRQAAVSARR